MIRLCLIPLGISTIVVLAGCSYWRATDVRNYQTVEAAPTRDSRKAMRENEQGLKDLDHGKLPQAEKHFQEALIADVTYGPAHNNLGKVYYLTNRFYLAAWEFDHAINLMPNNPEALNNLGLVQEAVGKLDLAMEAYEEAYALAPKHPEILGNLTRAKLRRGESDETVYFLLTEIVAIDTRPDWVAWAQKELALGQHPAGECRVFELPQMKGTQARPATELPQQDVMPAPHQQGEIIPAHPISPEESQPLIPEHLRLIPQLLPPM